MPDHATTTTLAGCGWLTSCTCGTERWFSASKANAQRWAAEHTQTTKDTP